MAKDNKKNDDDAKQDSSIIDLSGEELSEEQLLGIGPNKDDGSSQGKQTTTKPVVKTSKAAIDAAIKKFNIPLLVQEEYPKLIPLILETESMDDEEREYWFQMLPIMTSDQVKKFTDILITEKKQLAELDKEYEQEIAQLNEKHALEWESFEIQEEMEKIEKEEAKHEEEETITEEELLKKLQDL